VANPEKKHQWNLTYFDKHRQKTAVLRAHGVEQYRSEGLGDRRLWDRSTVSFARELAKAVTTRNARTPPTCSRLSWFAEAMTKHGWQMTIVG
jgi:hypothetical protein